MTVRKPRSRAARLLRPAFEMILLIGSLVIGVVVIGSCASAGSTKTDAALGVAGGVAFTIVLVGGVFLLTTMSRDLRKLRERYVESAEKDEAAADAIHRDDFVQT